MTYYQSDAGEMIIGSGSRTTCPTEIVILCVCWRVSKARGGNLDPDSSTNRPNVLANAELNAEFWWNWKRDSFKDPWNINIYTFNHKSNAWVYAKVPKTPLNAVLTKLQTQNIAPPPIPSRSLFNCVSIQHANPKNF